MAAEHLGDSVHAETATVLTQLLQHEAPVVREGTLYGLGRRHSLGFRHGVDLIGDVIRLRIKYMADHDSSPAVRQTAVDLLETLSED